jgi:hypothetical protein
VAFDPDLPTFARAAHRALVWIAVTQLFEGGSKRSSPLSIHPAIVLRFSAQAECGDGSSENSADPEALHLAASARVATTMCVSQCACAFLWPHYRQRCKLPRGSPTATPRARAAPRAPVAALGSTSRIR